MVAQGDLMGYKDVGIYQFYSMAQGTAPSSIKYKLTSSEKSSLQKLFDRTEVGDYFQRISKTSVTNQMLSSYYSGHILEGVEGQLRQGRLEVGVQQADVELLLDEPVIKEEEQQALEMKAKKAFIEKQLENLRMQTGIRKEAPEEDPSGVILSREEHKSLVRRIKKQREERQRKHQELLVSLHEKSRQKQQSQQKEREQRQKAELLLRREQIERSLLKHKEQHEHYLQIERESKEKMKAISAHKFKYQQIEDKFQKEVVMHNLEEKKRKLKEIRQYKALNIEQLKEHERSYLEKKKLTESRQTNRQNDWNYQPPERSERLTIILEEERLEKIKKVEDKKKQLDDKLARHGEYVNYLRENFVPKVDPIKKQEIEKRLQKEKKQRPESVDLKEIGMAYLVQAKKKRKKVELSVSRPESERGPTNPVNATNISIGSVGQSKARANTNYLSIDHDGQHFQKRRRKNIERLMQSQQMDDVDKIKQLRVESDKINENMQRKQRELKYKKDSKLKEDTLELLLSSIQAKIGIIQMYQ